MSRHRNYCFTINNYSEMEHDSLLNQEWYNYIILGKEIGESGTPHIQGYVELNNAISVKSLKKKFKLESVHLESRKGKQCQAIEYCKKDGKFTECGTKTQQGQRTDIDTVKEMISEGSSVKNVIESVGSYQGLKFAQTVLSYLEKPRDWNPNIIWIWGESGVGKSHLAHSISKNSYTVPDMKWWQGYDSHETVIFDNFTDGQIDEQRILKLLDKYPYIVESKGGSRQLRAKNYIVTSIYPPKDCYKFTKIYDEFMRRIKEYGKIIHLENHWSKRVITNEMILDCYKIDIEN